MLVKILLAVIVFVAAMALDFATANYSLAVNRKQAHKASRWSVCMFCFGAIGFISALKVSLWLMLPECLGLYIGTWFAVKRDLD